MNLSGRKCLKGYGRPVGTRTPDLYRVKVHLKLGLLCRVVV
jgi:hypothetical protein